MGYLLESDLTGLVRLTIHGSLKLLYLQVTSDGQCVGAVVAQSSTLARRAAQAVAVHYEDLTPVITIQVQYIKHCLIV